jgi:hypothetical protein
MKQREFRMGGKGGDRRIKYLLRGLIQTRFFMTGNAKPIFKEGGLAR